MPSAACVQPAGPPAPIVVLLHAGRYELAEPLIFNPEDSGTAESPTIYAAAPGDEGRVVISGGRAVTGWKPARGPRGEWVADLPGLKNGWRFRHVSIDGQWRDRPRLPDGETATYTMAGLAGANAKAAYDTPADRFEYAPGQIDPRWTGLGDVEVVVLHFWIDSHLKIARVEPNRHVVKLDRPSRYKFTDEHQPVPGRYYVANVYEALEPRPASTRTLVPARCITCRARARRRIACISSRRDSRASSSSGEIQGPAGSSRTSPCGA